MDAQNLYFLALLPVLLAISFLAPPVIGFAYIRVDADRNDQPG